MTQAELDLLRRLVNDGKWSVEIVGKRLVASITLDISGISGEQVTQLGNTLQHSVKDLVEEVARLRERSQVRR